jgi:hydrogenase nickel incorporation protein HypA/HybF
MHEMSLVESVLAVVEDERRKQPFSRVRMIRLAIGALGHAEPEALRFCFEAATNGTIAEGARLEIETIAGEGWCPRCRQAVPLPEQFAACPSCGEHQVRMTAGVELRVAEMEVE